MEDHALERVPEGERESWLKISWNTVGLVTTLVILFFMHAKYSSKLTKLFVGTAFFFLFILLTLTMTDFLSRGYATYDGGSAGAGYGVRTPRPPAVLKVDEGEAAAGAAEPAH